MAVVTILSIMIAVTGLCFALVMVPRWFARSAHRNRLWHLRDSFVDEILHEHLPAEHPAVADTLCRIERAIKLSGHLSLLQAGMFMWSAAGLSPEAASELDRRTDYASTEGLNRKQTEIIETYRDSMNRLLAGGLLIGSWLGVAVVLYLTPRAFREVRRQRTEGELYNRHAYPVPMAAVRDATDAATEETSLGRYAGKIVRDYVVPNGHMPVHA